MFDELRHNVALRVEETAQPDTFLVSGRGELHLAILIETMRREGFEFQVSRPEVIMKEGEDGELLEPYEEVHIETSPETIGAVVEMLGKRRGEMVNTVTTNNGVVAITENDFNRVQILVWQGQLVVIVNETLVYTDSGLTTWGSDIYFVKGGETNSRLAMDNVTFWNLDGVEFP